MQQQINPQEQCGNPQLPQPVMICPVQYVYETPMLLPQVPQTQGDQMQQNQILINVKNPPPWIQNRPQNQQVVYVQQLPNNYQPYIHPQMIQNPMYQPQMAYQIQPVLAQDNRQFIQIPNLNQFNTVQNATAQIQQVSEDNDKMPVLTQILNQRVNNTRAANVNNVRPSNVTTVANVVSAANAIRPITQNQQVQTDISANTKGRPRNVPPQIITINPMQQRQLLANQKQDIQINVRPQANIRTDVPQHIRTKIPSSISVKTINRPMHPRSIIRPFDVMPAPQNVYYSPIIMSAPSTETFNKNIMTYAESQYLKPNNVQDVIPRATVPMQLPLPTSNVLPFVKTEIKSPVEVVTNNKQIPNINIPVTSNTNLTKMSDDSLKKSVTESTTGTNTENQTQTEEKLVRNTVFVQARGRILNEKEFVQNNTLKRTIDDRLKEENKLNPATGNIVAKPENIDHSINKYIKLEITEKISEIKTVPENPPAAKVPVSIQTQQSRITNLQMNTNNAKSVSLNMPIIDEVTNISLNLNTFKAEESKSKDNKNIEECNQINTPTKTEEKYHDDKQIKTVCKLSNKETSLEKTNLEDIKKKEEKVTVLTHVLEGYIIQESNVAFPIQKPTIEKDIKKEMDTPNDRHQKENTKTMRKEENNDKKPEKKGHFPWRHLNSSIETEKEIGFAVIDKDDPFANIKKSTVESWTAEQLSSHLEKHNWTETASKLLDEEIDGESILLVNKDQLVAIGVSEDHAEAIVAFATKNS